jgi:hypothetical protein
MPSTPVASKNLLILLLTLAVMAFVGAAGAGPLGAIAAPDRVMADEKGQSEDEEQPSLEVQPKPDTVDSTPMPKLRPAGKVKLERPESARSRPASRDRSG